MIVLHALMLRAFCIVQNPALIYDHFVQIYILYEALTFPLITYLSCINKLLLNFIFDRLQLLLIVFLYTFQLLLLKTFSCQKKADVTRNKHLYLLCMSLSLLSMS